MTPEDRFWKIFTSIFAITIIVAIVINWQVAIVLVLTAYIFNNVYDLIKDNKSNKKSTNKKGKKNARSKN